MARPSPEVNGVVSAQRPAPVQVTVEDQTRTQPSQQPRIKQILKRPDPKVNDSNGTGVADGKGPAARQLLQMSYDERLANYHTERKRILGADAPHDEDESIDGASLLAAAALPPAATVGAAVGGLGGALLPTPDTPPILPLAATFGGRSSGGGARHTPDPVMPVLRQPSGPDGTRGFQFQPQGHGGNPSFRR
jgi:hypothetical protein